MNDSEFEDELRNLLPPAAPSTGLRARIDRELNAPHTIPHHSGQFRFVRLLRDFSWACAGAIAALLALAFLPLRPANATSKPASPAPVAQAGTSAFEHEESSKELLNAEDSDQVVETDDGPAREVRYNYRERHEWANPQTGARIVLEVPREDVYLMPVALQ